MRHPLVCAAALSLLACIGTARAQQVVKPPQAQAWIDVATYSGLGLPTGGLNPMAALGGLFGNRGGQGNTFGQTQTGGSGRFVDVTLYSRQNPQLTEAQQSVPAGFLPSPLKLQAPKETRGTPVEPGDDRVTDAEYERPKGKLMLYWGCGETVRAGQPRVIDFATASAADLAKVFQSRRATQRGTHAAAGRPVWPSPADARQVPDGASLTGEHAYTGSGVPDNFRFTIPPAQDLMPALSLQQRHQNGSTLLEWQPLPTARAYFISAMGARGENELVLWTSSEQPDAGFGLLDYQTNPAVDRWLKEQVLLKPETARCAVPKGALPNEGAMLRMIAYGSELNLAQPPRPADPKQPWEPVWAAKVRVKSVANALLGVEMPSMSGRSPQGETPAPKEESNTPGVKDLLKGILGR